MSSLTLSVDTADFPAPTDVALSADGQRAYVAVIGGSSEIFVVDLVALDLLPSIALPGGDFLQHGLGITEDGSTLLVTELGNSRVIAIDVESHEVLAEIATAPVPNEVGVKGGRAWITEQFGFSVQVVLLPGSFVRGEVNGDGSINVADGVAVLNHLFVTPGLDCLESADINNDGGIDLADPISLFTYLFQSGPPPEYPFPLPGGDLGDDFLGCDR